jgi:hypothetical protein
VQIVTEGRIAGTETNSWQTISETARSYREQGHAVEVRWARGVRPGLPVYVLHWAEPRREAPDGPATEGPQGVGV